MIQAALVSYLNTKPFIEGLEHFFADGSLHMDLLPPSQCSVSLREGRSAIALVPVGSLPDFKGLRLLKDYGIAADARVESVFIFAERPIQEIRHLNLDPHSRTSNGLARVLLRNYWKQEVHFQQPATRDQMEISGETAAVMIGDQAWRQRKDYPYVYDLATEWKKYCGLPFVFAVWAYWPDKVSPGDLDQINLALQWGTGQARKAALRYGKEFGYSDEEAIHYLQNCIDLKLDRLKHQALHKYFHELKSLPKIPAPTR